MKKNILCLLAIFGLLMTSFAFADTNLANYYSKYHKKTMNGNTSNTNTSLAANVKFNYYTPTDITIVNASANVLLINVYEPNGRFAFQESLRREENDHIQSDYYSGLTHIEFLTPSGFLIPFPQTYFCRYSVLVIYGGNGGPGSYRLNSDSTYCD